VKKTIPLLFFSLAVIFYGVVFLQVNHKIPEKEKVVLFFENISIRVDVVDTQKLRTIGLSGHAPLGEDEGMWFVFETPGALGMWMKNMSFPLDILWFNEKLELIYMKENLLPASYPEVFASPRPARYVLEVPAGFVKKNTITLGQKVLVQNIH
jgi:uncharacterized membrane protein (UPF0127 family)